jgi:branched-chain amino acid transport system ATP-binding protein
VPDDRRLCPTLTVAKNLAIARKRTRYRVLERQGRLRHLLASRAPDAPRGREPVGAGEMQMVAISRALLGSPGLVLFDEPSQGLAPKIVEDVLATIRRLQVRGHRDRSSSAERGARAVGCGQRRRFSTADELPWSGQADGMRSESRRSASPLRSLT